MQIANTPFSSAYRNGQELPPNFEYIPIKTSDKRMLQELGVKFDS